MPRRRLLERWYKNRIKLLAADSWRFWTRLGFFFFLFHTLEVLSLLVVRDRWIAFSTSNLSAFSKATLLLSGLFTGIAAVVFLIFWLGNVLEIDMILSETPEQKEKLDLLTNEVVHAKSTFLQCKAAVRLAAYALTILVSSKGFWVHKREACLYKRYKRSKRKIHLKRTFQETMRDPNAAPPTQSSSNETADKSGDLT